MKGGMLTIPPGIQDPKYRYKMPRMQLMQESRGNGVKTNIFNLEDIASALRVPSDAIIKYLCAEVGTNKEGTTIIKGKHTYDILLTHLTKFIIKYVCCKNCNYPEIEHFVEGKNDLKSTCKSCGSANVHDAGHKAGAALVKFLKSGGNVKGDIQKKDERDAKKDFEGEEEDKSGDDEEETKESKHAEDISDLEDDLTPTSRRVLKSIAAVD